MAGHDRLYRQLWAIITSYGPPFESRNESRAYPSIIAHKPGIKGQVLSPNSVLFCLKMRCYGWPCMPMAVHRLSFWQLCAVISVYWPLFTLKIPSCEPKSVECMSGYVRL
jgi:hypothetical protein